jgi:hypothetical protein
MAMAAKTPMTIPAIAPPDKDLVDWLLFEGLAEFVVVAVAVCVEFVLVCKIKERGSKV